MEEILCPHCFHEFEVEEYSHGECPNCHEMEYSWEEYWDENEPDDGWLGFEWNAVKDSKTITNDYVEIRAKFNIPSLVQYKDWTKVTRFLALGLQGIEMREII